MKDYLIGRKIMDINSLKKGQSSVKAKIRRQLISILGWGTIGGFLAYFVLFLLYCLIFISMGETADDFKFRIIETLIGVILVFVSCVINAVSKIKKEMKHSIVENIREL
jgi:hypothetical protein